jgi:hypothetical protein
MNRQTILLLIGAGAAYFFLTSRTPVFMKLADGTYKPAGLLDQLTVALTGAIPPPPQPVQQFNLTIPNVVGMSYTN